MKFVRLFVLGDAYQISLGGAGFTDAETYLRCIIMLIIIELGRVACSLYDQILCLLHCV